MSIEKQRNYEQGYWYLITNRKITKENLKAIDMTIQKHPRTVQYQHVPWRRRKRKEEIDQEMVRKLAAQNAQYKEATKKPPTNYGWATPRNKSYASITSANQPSDKSITTSITTSTNQDQLDALQSQLRNIQQEIKHRRVKNPEKNPR